MTQNHYPDVNKYIGIGTVADEPKVKYVKQTESYLIEFSLAVNINDPTRNDQATHPATHPVVVRRERLALFLKDVLSQSMRIYVEGHLIPSPQKPAKVGASAGNTYRIEATEIELIDRPDTPAYPEDIKKIK